MKLLKYSRRPRILRPLILTSGFIMLMLALLAPTMAEAVTAEVVMIDQALVFNRLGAQNVNGVIYALKRDVQQAGVQDPTIGFCADALLVPIAMYVYQIFTLFQEDQNSYDEFQIIYMLPLMAIIIPSIYLIRARIFNRINEANKTLEELEDELKITPKNLWGKVKEYF